MTGASWGSSGSISEGARDAAGRACGIDLGYRHGFNSGVMLDYVYENQARGRWGIGPLIDRGFLNAVGWRGIRFRKEHLKQALRRAIEQRRARGRATHIVDLAAGAAATCSRC